MTNTSNDLSVAQMQVLAASGPDDITGKEGVGVELRTGAMYAVAKSLERLGLGHVTGPGGSRRGMYWNNAAGLAACPISSPERREKGRVGG